MTYSITPSYQEQMGFGNTAEGEFGGTPIVTAPVVLLMMIHKMKMTVLKD